MFGHSRYPVIADSWLLKMFGYCRCSDIAEILGQCRYSVITVTQLLSNRSSISSVRIQQNIATPAYKKAHTDSGQDVSTLLANYDSMPER